MTFDAHRRFDDTLASTAGEFSRALGPSLEEVWMYAASDDPAWIIFVVTERCRSEWSGRINIGIELDGAGVGTEQFAQQHYF